MENGRRTGDGPDRRINSPDDIARQERIKNNPNRNGPMTSREFDAWSKMPMPKRPNVTEGSDEIASVGDIIRTKKMQMEGEVERTQRNRAGYMEVLFRLEDGRLMKTPMDNVTVVEKLADENHMEEALKFAPGSFPDVDHMPGAVYKDWGSGETNRKSFTEYETWKKYADYLNGALHDDNSEIVSDRHSETYGNNDRVWAAWNKATNTGYAKSDTNEGTMGGINRSAPANDVSYEKVLDEVKAKWLEEQKLDELSVSTMQNFKKKASSPDRIKQSSGFQKVKDKEGVDRANAKIKIKTGDRTVQGPYQYQGPARGTNEDCWDGYKQLGMKDKGGKSVPNCVPVDEKLTPWGGYTPDDKKAGALAKAPKSTMQGSTDFTMSDKVKDTINKHGVKYAFDYYVKKHGLPPRQFQVFAGLTANKPNATPQPPPAADPKKAPEKLSWWKRMLNSLGE
jgi:hypothetical protein